MTCILFQPVYAPSKFGGLNLAKSLNDGYRIGLEWDRAYASQFGNLVAYNIYYSTVRTDVISEGVKFVSIFDGYNVCIEGFAPGQLVFFAVRGTEYDPAWYDLTELQDGTDGLKVYTESLLLSDISDEALAIPVSDIADWPSFGVARVGNELIRYNSTDIITSSLIVSQRGFLDSNIRFHNTDGFDGYAIQNPIVRFFVGFEDNNLRIHMETSTFSSPNHAFTFADGYATNTDKLTSDLSNSDANLANFPEYDGVGWHRTDPKLMVQGKCLSTYIGGEQYCADGYLGIGRQTRGVPFTEQAARREELLLRTTGQPVMLVKRLWEGIRCACVRLTNEQPEKRCTKCFGTGFITGYEQFYNPRRSDGRILIRPTPWSDTLKFHDAGLESESIIEFWTLGYPAIKNRDIIVRYHKDGIEEFRYEVLDVTRNLMFDEDLGTQKFKAQRIRKTSPIYQWKTLSNTATMPSGLITNIGMLAGPGGTLIPHTHTVVINEGILALSQIDQTTSVTEGHNHEVRDGVVQETLGHFHSIILP